ncbi:hypothetical protein L6452_21947 [Arctium lappa]|uniref:Uncharacterized protein n=1 Tax=Arctium lappa TaxID=4217 RepID=A0ACB9AZA5_ARCLA|nr:hypothetical protein L6452_21947 [Arctium lappa]
MPNQQLHMPIQTHVHTSDTVGRLSDPAGTPIVNLPIGGLRGLGGSPTTAIITPTVNVGGTTSTVATTTGSLCDPCVSFPEFVSRDFLYGTLKVVHSLMRSEMKDEVDALKRMFKGGESPTYIRAQVSTGSGTVEGDSDGYRYTKRSQVMDLVLYDANPMVKKLEECDRGEEYMQREDYDNLFEHVVQDHHSAEHSSTGIPLLTYSTYHPDQSQSDHPIRSPPVSPVHETKSTQPAPPLKWERVRINIPFLEESQKKLFAHWIRPYDEVAMYGLQSMTDRKKQHEYIFMYKSLRKVNSPDRTKHRIRTVDQIYSCRFMSIWYSLFVVTRDDGNQWQFSEADFASLELPDLLFLLRDMKTRNIRPGEVTNELEAVKRYMKCAMKLGSIEDFQIGLESIQTKINLLKPDQSLPPDFHNVPAYTVVKFPEFGMTYFNGKSDMWFF